VLPEVDTWDLRSRRFVRLEIRGLARSREMSKLIGRFDANLASNLRERERVDEEIARSNGPLYSSRISAREKIRNCRNGEQESLAGSRFPETVALSPRAGTSRILTQDFPFAQTLARARARARHCSTEIKETIGTGRAFSAVFSSQLLAGPLSVSLKTLCPPLFHVYGAFIPPHVSVGLIH